MGKIKQYLKNSVAEFNNVTWPTRKQAIRISTIVFIVMVISAAILGVVDQLLSLGYKFLLNL